MFGSVNEALDGAKQWAFPLMAPLAAHWPSQPARCAEHLLAGLCYCVLARCRIPSGHCPPEPAEDLDEDGPDDAVRIGNRPVPAHTTLHRLGHFERAYVGGGGAAPEAAEIERLLDDWSFVRGWIRHYVSRQAWRRSAVDLLGLEEADRFLSPRAIQTRYEKGSRRKLNIAQAARASLVATTVTKSPLDGDAELAVLWATWVLFGPAPPEEGGEEVDGRRRGRRRTSSRRRRPRWALGRKRDATRRPASTYCERCSAGAGGHVPAAAAPELKVRPDERVAAVRGGSPRAPRWTTGMPSPRPKRRSRFIRLL